MSKLILKEKENRPLRRAFSTGRARAAGAVGADVGGGGALVRQTWSEIGVYRKTGMSL